MNPLEGVLYASCRDPWSSMDQQPSGDISRKLLFSVVVQKIWAVLNLATLNPIKCNLI